MGDMSDYLKNEWRKHIFRTGSFTKPTALYYGLYTAAPTDAGGGTEVTGGSYARVNLAPLDANYDAHATAGRTRNQSTITFPSPTAAWGTVTHMGVFDASTAGNLLFWKALNTPRVINNGDPAPVFNANAFDVQID